MGYDLPPWEEVVAKRNARINIEIEAQAKEDARWIVCPSCDGLTKKTTKSIFGDIVFLCLHCEKSLRHGRVLRK